MIAVEGDISDPATGTELVEQTVAAFGRVDVLASNSGICPFHAFLDLSPETPRQTLGVNLESALYVVQAAARQMQRQGEGGAIIATSSISALVGGGMRTHYTPTKACIR